MNGIVQRLAWVLLAAVVCFPAGLFAAEEPLCRIAALAYPYVTALPAEAIKDLRGGKARPFIKANGLAAMNTFVESVNRLKPDAVLLVGSLTWTGSDADIAELKTHLDKLAAPAHLLPSETDLANDGLARLRAQLPRCQVHTRGVAEVKGVRLLLNGASVQTPATKEALEWFAEALGAGKGARAVVQVGGPAYPWPVPAAPSDARRYWYLVEEGKVALRLTGAHAHLLGYENTLPTYQLSSPTWQARSCALFMISVYADRIDLAMHPVEPGLPLQRIVVPNPVAAARWPAAEADPYGSPTYSRDLALKPELSFVHLSDSQFDDQKVPRTGARYALAEPVNASAAAEVNKLKPAFVLMTGDLVNKCTPAEWATFNRIYDTLAAPLYPLPGNHDRVGTREDAEKAGDLREVYLANVAQAEEVAKEGFTGPLALYRKYTKKYAAAGKTTYTFEKNGSVFICIDASTAALDKAQLQWLEGELERARDAKHLFVVGHHPLLTAFGNNVGEGRDEALALLKKHRVTAYLFGHRHGYGYRMQDGVVHVMCDCLCWGETCSYMIAHVFPDRIVFCWKPVGKTPGRYPLYEQFEFAEPRAAR